MRIMAQGQFADGMQLEMTEKEHGGWLKQWSYPQIPVASDKGSMTSRIFYVINGQPITVYLIPEKHPE